MTMDNREYTSISPYSKVNIEKYNGTSKHGERHRRRNLTGGGKSGGAKSAQAVLLLCLGTICFFLYEAVGVLYYQFVVPNFPKSWPDNAAMQDTVLCAILAVVYLVWYLVMRRRDFSGTVLFHQARGEVGASLNNVAYANIIKRGARRYGFSGKYRLPKISTFGFGIPIRIVYLLVIGFGIGGAAALWMMLVDAKLDAIPWIHESYKALQSGVSELEGGGSVLFSMLSVAIVGPIVEELMFRGVLVEYLGRLTNRKWVIILGSGILFGVWHANFVQGVYASILGIVLALVLYRTKSILWPILIHILNNSIDVLTGLDSLSAVSFPVNMTQVIMVAPMIVLIIFSGKLFGNQGFAGMRN